MVLGLPRGGVPVAFEVARALGAPLDVIVVRKLGVPFQPELGMGAIGEDGVRVINPEVVRLAGVAGNELAAVEARERAELDRRARRVPGRPAASAARRAGPRSWSTTGSPPGRPPGPPARSPARTAQPGSCSPCRSRRPDGTARMAERRRRVRLPRRRPEPFFAIGQFYEDFSQTSDDEVVACLQRAARR